MMTSFGALVRGSVVALLMASGVAVGMARLLPRATGYRLWQEPRHAAINGTFFSPTYGPTEVFNTETGTVVPFNLPEGETLQWVAFSEWIDDDGQSQVVGRWTARTGDGGASVLQASGVGRYTFPGARPLNRVNLDHAPVSTPCWYPGSTSRVLYAAGDGRLYHYEFKDAGHDGAVIDDKAQPIAWPGLPPGVIDVIIEDPCWPQSSLFGGRILAAISFITKHGPKAGIQGHQIWWLQLDRAGTTIVDAGRLSIDEPDAGDATRRDADERFPRLRASSDGELLLAYQVHRDRRNEGELRVARIGFDPRTEVPVIRHAEACKLLARCAPVPPIFTAAGDGVFALLPSAQGAATLQRVALSESLLPKRSGSYARRPAARRSLSYHREPSADGAAHPG